jgi:hypothetical protein
VGRGLGDEIDFNDSISLCEVRGGAFNKQPCENQISTQETLSTETLRRGRSRKRRGRPKLPRPPKQSKQSILGVPKFVQLADVVKEGCARRRSRRKGGVKGAEQVDSSENGGTRSSYAASEGESCSPVQESCEGLNLEVVLPAIEVTPNSGIALLVGEGGAVGGRPLNADYESTKLLQIQQAVGFGYDEPIDEVIAVLDKAEQRDRVKKQE